MIDLDLKNSNQKNTKENFIKLQSHLTEVDTTINGISKEVSSLKKQLTTKPNSKTIGTKINDLYNKIESLQSKDSTQDVYDTLRELKSRISVLEQKKGFFANLFNKIFK